MADVEQIKSRFKAAEDKRRVVEAEVHDAFWWTSPNGSPLHKHGTVEDRLHQFATTAEQAVDDLAAEIIQLLLPQSKHWVDFDVSALYRARQLPEGQTSIGLAQDLDVFYAALDETFYLQVVEALKQAIISGSGCLGLTMQQGRLRFMSVPFKQLFYTDDGYGNIDTAFRDFHLPARTIVARYKNAPQWIADISKTKPDERVEILEAMTPGKKPNSYEFSVWSKKDWKQLQSQPLPDKCFIVFRYEKLAGETMGTSPLRKALANIRMENNIGADLIDVSAFTAGPPIETNDPHIVDQGLKARKTFLTSEGTYIKPIQLGSDYKVHIEIINGVKNAIRAQMMVDGFDGIGDRSNQALVAAKQAAHIGGLLAPAKRLSAELLKPMVRSIIAHLRKAGQIQMFDPDNWQYRLVTDSIAEQLEKDQQNQRIVQAVMTAAQMSQINLPGVPMQKVILHVLRESGVPSKYLPSDEQMDAAQHTSNLVQGVAGAMQTATGQGSPETSQATGAALAQALPKMLGNG